MGCIHCKRRGDLDIHTNKEIRIVSYNQRKEKIQNHLNPSNKDSNLGKNVDPLPMADIMLTDITHSTTTKHHNFPRWLGPSRCRYCGCRCHGKVGGCTKLDEVKNNKRRPNETLTNLAGHAFANVLAMVGLLVLIVFTVVNC